MVMNNEMETLRLINNQVPWNEWITVNESERSGKKWRWPNRGINLGYLGSGTKKNHEEPQ
jgi:hypothetical protein